MRAEQYIALFGAAAVALFVRVSNMLIRWLARILGVDAEPPIPLAGTDPIPPAVPGDGSPQPPKPAA